MKKLKLILASLLLASSSAFPFATGIPNGGSTGPQGAQGLSAYQIGVSNGFVGTQQQWLDSLKGAKGDTGVNGTNGTNGTNGSNGTNGISAYQSALNAGFVGTEAQWLASLKGANGTNGLQGIQGLTGATGATGPSPKVSLGNITLSETAIVSISAGIRTITITGISGLLAGDDVILFPISSLPNGYAIHNSVATANGTLQVTLNAPLLAIGGSYNIVCKVVALR